MVIPLRPLMVAGVLMYFPLFFKVLSRSPSSVPGAIFAATMLASCTTPPAPEVSEPACPEIRPMVCTTIYAPVCATHSDGRLETHASSCNACADESVVDYLDGPCEENAQ